MPSSHIRPSTSRKKPATLSRKNSTTEFPALTVKPHHGDYFSILDSLRDASGVRKVILFLGSNIGNFSREEAVSFFRHLRSVMNPADRLFIGFDMQKDPHVIVRGVRRPARRDIGV